MWSRVRRFMGRHKFLTCFVVAFVVLMLLSPFADEIYDLIGINLAGITYLMGGILAIWLIYRFIRYLVKS